MNDIVETAIGGKTITTTVEGRERYPVNVRYARAPVLRAVMGGEEDDVQAVLDARASDPGSALTLVQAKVGDQTIARRLTESKIGINQEACAWGR